MPSVLPWLPISTQIPDHPKIIALENLLGDEGDALGIVVRLWLWVAKHSPTGVIDIRLIGDEGTSEFLTRKKCEVNRKIIAKITKWRGEPEEIAKKLIAVGLLDDLGDGRLSIHDWEEHAGAFVEKADKDRANARERMRRYYERKKALRGADQDPDFLTRKKLAENVIITRIERDVEREKDPPPPPPPQTPTAPIGAKEEEEEAVRKLWSDFQEQRHACRHPPEARPPSKSSKIPSFSEWARERLRETDHRAIVIGYRLFLRDENLRAKNRPTRMFMLPEIYEQRLFNLARENELPPKVNGSTPHEGAGRLDS